MQIEFLRSGTNGSSCSQTFFKIGLQPSNFIKRRLHTGVFLWILQNFQEQLFHTPIPPHTPNSKLNQGLRLNIPKHTETKRS